jgi:hypothetical protein
MRGKQEIGTQGGAGIMKFTVDPTYLDEKAAAWWKAKTPAMRGVLMQAVYELETSTSQHYKTVRGVGPDEPGRHGAPDSPPLFSPGIGR